MIEQVPTYRAVCDRCGEAHDEGDYIGWADRETALEVALDSDWQQIDGRLLCWGCWGYGIDGETIVEMAP